MLHPATCHPVQLPMFPIPKYVTASMSYLSGFFSTTTMTTIWLCFWQIILIILDITVLGKIQSCWIFFSYYGSLILHSTILWMCLSECHRTTPLMTLFLPVRFLVLSWHTFFLLLLSLSSQLLLSSLCSSLLEGKRQSNQFPVSRLKTNANKNTFAFFKNKISVYCYTSVLYVVFLQYVWSPRYLLQ